MKQLTQGFSTAAQDLNLGSRSRESAALPPSHCALQMFSAARCSALFILCILCFVLYSDHHSTLLYSVCSCFQHLAGFY